METEDIIYLCVLFSCIPLSYGWRHLSQPFTKQVTGGILGLVIAVLVCGWQLGHSLFTATVNYAIIRLAGPRYCHLASFIFCFGYLAFFRLTTYFGFEEINPHANVVQLVLTIKMVSLAFDVHDDFDVRRAEESSKEKKSSGIQEDKKVRKVQYSMAELDDPKLIGFEMPCKLPTVPDPIEFYCFTYCFVVLLTGPFYRLSAYRHAVWRADAASIPTLKPMLKRIMPFPLYAAISLYVGAHFPHTWITSEEYLSRGLLYQLAYLIPAFMAFRVRFYAGWSLAEAACISAGIGAYPEETDPQPGQGPSKPLTSAPSGKFSFKAVHALDVWAIESAPDMRTAIRHWNMTVQWWMTHYVYKRFPVKSLRYGIVFFISAYWHGVHLGYYLCFMSNLITGFMEARLQIITASLRRRSLTNQKLLDFVGWLLTYRLFEYLSVGFMIRLAADTIYVWTRTYFFGHVVALGIALLTFLVPCPRDLPSQSQSSGKKEQ